MPAVPDSRVTTVATSVTDRLPGFCELCFFVVTRWMDARPLHNRYLLDAAGGKNIAGVGLCTLVSAGF